MTNSINNMPKDVFFSHLNELMLRGKGHTSRMLTPVIEAHSPEFIELYFGGDAEAHAEYFGRVPPSLFEEQDKEMLRLETNAGVFIDHP